MPNDPQQADWNFQIGHRPTSLPPSGPAGGDLSGTYPDPTVSKILNRPLSMAGIATNRVLTWNGSSWVPLPSTAGMTGVFQFNPNSGPFTGTTLSVDHSTGLIGAAGPTLSLELASLTQMGGIGAGGFQRLQGPLFFEGQYTFGGLPAFATSAYSAIISDGILGFWDLAEDSTGNPCSASIDWARTAPHTLTMFSNRAIFIVSGAGGGATTLYNASSTGSIALGAAGSSILIYDPTSVILQTGTGALVSGTMKPGFGTPTSSGFHITKTSGGNPLAYGIGTSTGQTGTMLDGSHVEGGLITLVGSTLPGGSPTGAASGDLTGSYPGPTIAKLQTITLVATGGSSGDVLTYSGGQWKPLPIPLQTSLVHVGGTIQVDGSGNCVIWPDPTGGLGFYGATPVGQATALGTTAGFTANTSLNSVFSESTFDGGLGGSAYTLGDMVRALIKVGLLAS